MRSWSRVRLSQLIVLLVAIALAPSSACQTFDETRRPAIRGTLGEEIVRVFCERMARDVSPDDVTGERWKPVCRGMAPAPADAPPALVALMGERPRLVAALDRLLPEQEHGALGDLLQEILPLYDPPNYTLPSNTEQLAAFLDVLREDPEALAALGRIAARSGYRPSRLGLSVVRPFLQYEQVDEVLDLTLDTFIADDGSAHAEFVAVEAALAMELATLEANDAASADPTTLTRLRELLFRTHPDIAGTRPRYVVARDRRGIVLPAGGVVSPFVDLDGDGLADVDTEGRFVDAARQRLSIPTPFALRNEGAVPRDANGRALSTTGDQLYTYVDVDQSLLGALVREARPWFLPASPTAIEIARGLPPLLGTDSMRREQYGSGSLTYLGWDTTTSPALDLVYVGGELVGHPETEDLLDLLERLIENHESDAAGVVFSAQTMLESSGQHPESALEQPNVLWDDLMRLGREYAQQGDLLERLIRAFADPRSRSLGPVFSSFMRYRDSVDYSRLDANDDPVGLPLDEPVDRAAPDMRGNESVFERTLALIDGMNGVRMCNRQGAALTIRVNLSTRAVDPHCDTAASNCVELSIGNFDECELFEIPNVAEAFTLSILGRYELVLKPRLLQLAQDAADRIGLNIDLIIEQASDIRGLTRHPTPQALSRLMFWGLSRGERNEFNSPFVGALFAPVLDRNGDDVISTYQGTIFAWETPGFFEGMRPVLEVWNEPQFRLDVRGNYTFGEFISTVYRHWPTRQHFRTQRTDPRASDFNYQENARSYEPIIAEGLGAGRLVENLVRAAQTLDAFDAGGGRDGLDVLSDTTTLLLDPAATSGLRTRDGRTNVPWNDGSTSHAVTPLVLLIEALSNIDETFERVPERRDALHAGRDRIARQLLHASPLGEGYRFDNRRGRAILQLVVPWLRERVIEHRDRGDLVAWGRDWPSDFGDVVNSPLAAGVVRLLEQTDRDPEGRDALLRFVSYMLDESSPNDAFDATLLGAGDLLYLLDDGETIVPLAHALSPALAANARELALGRDPGTPDTENALATRTLDLVRTIQGYDQHRTLRAILERSVALDEEDETALGILVDVLGEVNRAAPGAGTPFESTDYRESFHNIADWLLDGEHGMERLYRMVQNRCVAAVGADGELVPGACVEASQ